MDIPVKKDDLGGKPPIFGNTQIHRLNPVAPAGPAGRVPAFTWRADGKVHRTARGHRDSGVNRGFPSLFSTVCDGAMGIYTHIFSWGYCIQKTVAKM